LFNSSLNFQRLNLFIENSLNELKSEIEIKKNKSISIPSDFFNRADEFLIYQLIKNSVDENFNVQTESSDINKIYSIKNKQSGKTEELSNHLLVLKERGRVIIKANKSLQENSEKKIKIGETVKINDKNISIIEATKNKIKIGKSKNIEFISGDKIKGAFKIRNWKTGDKFYPIGMFGTKKLSDYLTDVKINPGEKKSKLVLINNKKIVWVIGLRLDDRFKITPKTKKVLQLCLK
jgi:tRNA(Ile)-lysidine synthase